MIVYLLCEVNYDDFNIVGVFNDWTTAAAACPRIGTWHHDSKNDPLGVERWVKPGKGSKPDWWIERHPVIG